ncbi:metal ABC transporter solute-binding protein, Zn/Mn family [Ornithinibacillus sp. 179-J 7C1 HS]|uniref:metal ABC transporter solute-binding protein, Zn/Mn family n=1 Tax=Ornithinibacillus sp. 179-J 7C1 HS TaxID=3142384 RepID=UPI0039A18495
MKPISVLLTIILLSILFFGCQSETSNIDQNHKLTIYTSLYPINYLVNRIGAETAVTKSVLPPGVDAHAFEPTIKAITHLARSDAFIYMGKGMEGFTENIANALELQDIKLLALGEYEELFHGIRHSHDGDVFQAVKQQHTDKNKETNQTNLNQIDPFGHEGHNHSGEDPHVWIDPLRMIEMGHIIASFLIELNPTNKDSYITNFNSLKEELLKLDKLFVNTLDSKINKKILVSHAAYGYWEERYGIEQISINGISSSSEPSQKDLVDIIEQANTSNLHYIILEQNTKNNVSEIIQEYIDAELLNIHNLSVLTDKDIHNHEDYFSLMKKNLNVLDKATK